MSHLDRVQHLRLLHLVHLALHHHDVVERSAYHNVNVSFLQLRIGRVDNELSIHTCYTDLRDRAFERNVGNRQCSGSGQTSQRIWHILAIRREKNNVYIHLSVVIAREKRTQSTVHQTSCQDLIIRRLSLSLRETSRETSERGIFLFVINLQRHEINSRICVFSGTYGSKQHGVVHTNGYRSICLLRQLSGLDGDGTSIT